MTLSKRCLFAAALLVCPLLVAQVAISPVHYYLHEYTDEEGFPEACGIEIHSDSVEESPGPEFQEVTFEELH